MLHILWEAFYWPGGCLLGNLLANIIWAAVFDWPNHRKTRRHVERHAHRD